MADDRTLDQRLERIERIIALAVHEPRSATEWDKDYTGAGKLLDELRADLAAARKE